MILDIVRYPDPLLKTPCRPVEFNDPALGPFIENMIETMYHYPRCVGLAANQVGKSWHIFVADASRIDKPGSRHGLVVFLNARRETIRGTKPVREGCLSVPDYTGNVIRSESIVVSGADQNGKERTIEATGFEAIVFQHELDHLDGCLFLDRVASMTTDVFRRKNYG